jgi:hypothetical protein
VEQLQLGAVERSRIREQVVAELAQAHRLQALEQEKLMSDLRASIQELQLKATRGSQQRAGEVLETEVFDLFRRDFPHDEWARIGKGRNGADIVQRVRDAQGRDAGRILWEIKNTATWSPKWIAKIRKDAQSSEAELCVIVSASLPKDLQSFGEIDGVWVTNLQCHSGVALALRAQLLTYAELRKELTGQGCSDAIRDYLHKPAFKQQVQTIARAAAGVEAQIQREKQLLTRHWAERQQFATLVTENFAALCLGLKGVTHTSCAIVHNPGILLDGGDAPTEGFPAEPCS